MVNLCIKYSTFMGNIGDNIKLCGCGPARCFFKRVTGIRDRLTPKSIITVNKTPAPKFSLQKTHLHVLNKL